MNKKSKWGREDGSMPLLRWIHQSLLMALIDVVLDIERRVSKATLGMVQVQVDALEALINLEITLVRRFNRG